MPKKSPIGDLASADTKAQFADDLSRYTTLPADEIQKLFPEKADQEKLVELLKIVSSAASDNDKRAALIATIDTVAGAVLKLVSRVARRI